MTDPAFPSSEFDEWAESYDASVNSDEFPFWGYKEVLGEIVRQANVTEGSRVLDLGTGTGNLAGLFAAKGCELWGTDFSPAMLEKARLKLPSAQFFLHDLREDLPAELPEHFDSIVSAYVFHHFGLDEKIQIIQKLMTHLSPSGRMVIGDIAFPDQTSREKVKQDVGDSWEEEYYWIADEAIAALNKISLRVDYKQVSACAGIFRIGQG